MILRALVLASSLVAASCSTAEPPAAGTAHAADPATPTTIAWETFDAGVARAHREGKPYVMVFTATWCSQCEVYRSVLADPQVIAASDDFVMIRVDITEQPELNQRHAYDGTYVPRTLFFTPEGQHRAELRAPRRDRYLYFLDPRDPSELLGLMRRALGAG